MQNPNRTLLVSKWLSAHLKSGVKASSILASIEKKLGFLVYAPKEDAETGIMFEVINNRGKQLSELEKVKNYLIYCSVKLSASTLRNSIDSDWSDILHNLNTAKKTSSSDEGAFLRYCVAVHFMLNKTDSQHGYDELKKLINIDLAVKNNNSKKETIIQIKEFVAFLKAAALWYARLFGQQHNNIDPRLSTILNQLRAQGQQASIMPIFLALVLRLKGEGEQLVTLLRLLEILNFRVYMARNMTSRNDTGQGDLYFYASHYYHNDLLKYFMAEQNKLGKRQAKTQEDAIEYYLVTFILWYATEQRFEDSFILENGSPDDFYNWRGLRYFLMNYEAKLQPNKTIPIDKILKSRKEGKSSDYLSIEHVWAKENRNKEGENNRSVDKFEKRRLGNFVLIELRLNIQGGNDSLELKLSRYLKGYDGQQPTDLAQVRRMGRDAKKTLSGFEGKIQKKNYFNNLYKELNSLQEKRYVKFANERWSIKEFLGYRQLINEAKRADANET